MSHDSIDSSCNTSHLRLLAVMLVGLGGIGGAELPLDCMGAAAQAERDRREEGSPSFLCGTVFLKLPPLGRCRLCLLHAARLCFCAIVRVYVYVYVHVCVPKAAGSIGGSSMLLPGTR